MAVTAVAGSGTAFAADNSVVVYSNTGNVTGKLTHIDDGDQFRVYDMYADGHGVRGILFDANFKVLATAYNGKGASGGYTSFGYDIKGGNTYYMRICTVDGADDTTGRCNEEKLTE
ncbi:hypothetical protein [Kribbella catacumbae]|uniref:hypothetical protein n=1 Tax=Kribbella catacumbae TaxID=460086 RepID=UPI0003A52930|nr:hypothetical protein [Kribbella catacumbae]